MVDDANKNSPISILSGVDCKIGGRTNLEDRTDVRALTTKGGLSLTVAMVADGVGGSNYGERAAELALQVAFQTIEASDLKDPNQLPNLLQQALQQANEAVYQEGIAEKEKRGMGSTAVLVAVHNNRLYLANVGDSRAYLVRGAKGEQVIQLTRDHTWAREMVIEGRLSANEANKHPKAEELVRSIGYAPEVRVDLGLYQHDDEKEEVARQWQGMPLVPNDRIILCSDGLIKTRHNGSQPYVSEAEMAQMVRRYPPQQAAPALVQLALSRQADDNVSAVVLEVPGSKRAFFIPPVARYAGSGGLVVLVLVSLMLLWLPDDPEPTSGATAVTAEATIAEVTLPKETAVSIPTFTPRPTQDPGQVQESLSGKLIHDLPGGVKLFLDENTMVDVLSSNSSAGGNVIHLLLKQGQLVVESNNGLVIVSNEFGARAELTGGLMGVSNDREAFNFSIACMRGECTLLGDLEGIEKLMAGQSSFVGGSGRPAAPNGADYAPYYAFAGSVVPPPTATPTATLTPTPTDTPTPTRRLPIPTPMKTPVPPTETIPAVTIPVVTPGGGGDIPVPPPNPTDTPPPDTPPPDTPTPDTPTPNPGVGQ